MPGNESGGVLARSAQPFPEVGADRDDGIFPHPVNGRGKVVFIAGGDVCHNFLKYLPRPIEVAWPHGEQVLVPQAREQLELDIMDEGAALQRIEVVDYGGHLTWRDTMDGLKKEAVRAARKVLKLRR